MLDDLREQAGDEEFFDPGEEDIPDLYEGFDNLEQFEEEEAPVEKKPKTRGPFLGLLPHQRFVVAFFLLILTILVGFFLLVITGTVVP